MNENELPIGIFDSGMGGVSVLKCAAKALPYENFIYFGDTANAPYGDKSEEEIQKLTLKCGEFLYQKGVKAMLIACNTATSAAVIKMRDKFKMPVISMEPAVKPAMESSQDGLIVVMATAATIAQKRYRLLIERLGCINRVVNIPCCGLVELVEKGDFNNPEIDAYIKGKLNPLAGENVCGIVIGCTHYSFVSKNIERAANEILVGNRRIFDGKYGTVRQLGRILSENNIENKGVNLGQVKFYSSAGEKQAKILEKIFEQD